jgi:hypothetical protein
VEGVLYISLYFVFTILLFVFLNLLIPQIIQPENSNEIYVKLQSFPVGLKVFEYKACSIYSPHMFINYSKAFSEKSKYSNPSVLWILVVLIPIWSSQFQTKQKPVFPSNYLINGLDHLVENWKNLLSELDNMGEDSRGSHSMFMFSEVRT